MLRHFAILAAARCLWPISSAALARDKVQRVSFKDGRAVVRGVIKGYDTHDYVFPVGAGETISASLESRLAFFNLNPPGSTEAFFNGSVSDNATFKGNAASSGDYTARVYLMRNEARRGKAAPYTLTIALGGASEAADHGPDFADGLTGGPDNWEVTGVGAGDALQLRATPSPKGGLVAQAPNGATLKNLGCRNTRGQRWCQVEDARGHRGWANGRYLREP